MLSYEKGKQAEREKSRKENKFESSTASKEKSFVKGTFIQFILRKFNLFETFLFCSGLVSGKGI